MTGRIFDLSMERSVSIFFNFMSISWQLLICLEYECCNGLRSLEILQKGPLNSDTKGLILSLDLGLWVFIKW